MCPLPATPVKWCIWDPEFLKLHSPTLTTNHEGLNLSRARIYWLLTWSGQPIDECPWSRWSGRVAKKCRPNTGWNAWPWRSRYDKHTDALVGFANLGNINQHLQQFAQSLQGDNITEPLAKFTLVLMIQRQFTYLQFQFPRVTLAGHHSLTCSGRLFTNLRGIHVKSLQYSSYGTWILKWFI